ncbi:PilW family protein [Litorivicinus lipolyticus]|uniref:PilW family protein n=1 Tax=Litorivicinus lipolyticus TaxID=418701 RepID=UPI003B5A5514
MKRQSGLSLVELMISLLLGSLIVIAAMTLLSTNSQQLRDQTAKTALQENSRVALDILGNHIRLAGFYGTMDGDDPLVARFSTGLANNRCQGTVLDSTQTRPALQVRSFANTAAANAAYDCIAQTNIDLTSPVLEVRSVDGVPVPPNNASAPLPNDSYYVQASPGGGSLFFGNTDYQALLTNFEDRVYADGGPVEVMRWQPAIYYVRPCSNPSGSGATCTAGDDPTPMLVRQRLTMLGTQPAMIEEPLVSGVERVDYLIGLADANGQIDRYAPHDSAGIDWSRAVSIRLALVVRETSARGGTDTSSYTLPSGATWNCTDSTDAGACQFNRSLFGGTYNLRNRIL